VRYAHIAAAQLMSDTNLAREPDFSLGALRLSPSTVQAFDGERAIRVEALTMSVLVVLARNESATVSRDDLVRACWQGRIISDDAIARAIAKVRALARETAPQAFTLHTVPKVGYRLTAAESGARSEPRPPLLARALTWQPRRHLAIAAAAVAAIMLIWGANALVRPSPASTSLPVSAAPQSDQVYDALMTVDLDRLALYIRSGWDPNWRLDSEGNTALHILPQACERHPTSHDREGVLQIAQFLVEAGNDPTTRNIWNDTPLIIAATPRYCGPDHPVTVYLRSLPTE
jgi:DNA-binding winged helix-turn-helix (wHTH) protein